MSIMERPRVGVSSCLLGEEVRFNGGHKRSGPARKYFFNVGVGTLRAARRLTSESRGGGSPSYPPPRPPLAWRDLGRGSAQREAFGERGELVALLGQVGRGGPDHQAVHPAG